MRAIVLIEWGPRRWQKTVIAPGERLRVGRMERADLVVPHDEALSGLHFELSWDGARCALRDLGSAQGTFLNGKLVDAGEVAHGEWLRAGRTFFSVYFEGVVPPWTPPAGKARAPLSRKTEALAALRGERAPLFAVLDAAREDRIRTLLRSSAEQAQSLYEGREGEELEDVAPFLVALPRDGQLLERLVHEGWGERWGLYLVCRRPFKEVRRQLRRQLIVEVKGTEELLYFRFYDPKAMAAAVRVCRPRQKQELFGDVEAFLVEGTEGEVVRLTMEG